MRSAAPDLATIAPLLDRDGFAIAPSGLESKALADATSAIEDALRDVEALLGPGEALPAPLRWRTGAPAEIAPLAIDAHARAV